MEREEFKKLPKVALKHRWGKYEKCPVCGRKGKTSWYIGNHAGTGIAVHVMRLDMFGFVSITDFCTLKREKP